MRFDAVRFRYPGQSDVLAGVDLELAAGTSTAIVGVNGAGKSTLVTLLSRLRDPTGGRITVDGVDVRELDARRWQRTVAIMPQEPARYPVSAYDNIAFGALEYADDSAGRRSEPAAAGFSVVSTSCRAAGTPCCPANCPAAPTCPAASGSGWRWPARCSPPRTAPACWYSTNRPPRSTSAAKPASTNGSWTSRPA